MKKIPGAGFFFSLKKHGTLLLFLCFASNAQAQAQEFRLRYDSSSIPELYNQVYIILEEKKQDGYHPFKGKYKLETTDGNLKGNEFFFQRNPADDSETVAHFKVTVD